MYIKPNPQCQIRRCSLGAEPRTNEHYLGCVYPHSPRADRLHRPFQIRIKTPYTIVFVSDVAHLASYPLSLSFPCNRPLPPHYPASNAAPHFSCRRHTDGPKHHRPMPLVRATSKTPSFHIAHGMHRPSQVWTSSQLERSLLCINLIRRLSYVSFSF